MVVVLAIVALVYFRIKKASDRKKAGGKATYMSGVNQVDAAAVAVSVSAESTVSHSMDKDDEAKALEDLRVGEIKI